MNITPARLFGPIPTFRHLLLLNICFALWTTEELSHAQSLQTLKSFGILTNKVGSSPYGELVQGADGFLYGVTSKGGVLVGGSIFKISTNSDGFGIVHQLVTPIEGSDSRAGLVSDGVTLYGTTTRGGANNGGTVFKVGTDGTGFAVLKAFPAGSFTNVPSIGLPTEMRPPMGGLFLSGSMLYGTTRSGGAAGQGTVFKINVDGSGYAVVKEFGGAVGGAAPCGELVLDGSTLYGTTAYGGNSNTGTVFKVNADGSAFAILKHFTSGTTDGREPLGGLILAGSTLYGTTYSGGTSSAQAGTVFKIETNGSGFALLKSFDGGVNNGGSPAARLRLSGSLLYGTTSGDAGGGFATVFSVATNGAGFAAVKKFDSRPFEKLRGAVILVNGTIFGTTADDLNYSLLGTIFKVATDGTGYTQMHKFVQGSGDGVNPDGLVLSEGTLYGSTFNGGTADVGSIFKVETNGTGYVRLYDFQGDTDGAHPLGQLAVIGGTIFGMTGEGGAITPGGIGVGTVFKVNTDGSGYTVLRRFVEVPYDGLYPSYGLTAVGDRLYGTTVYGGTGSGGVLFQMDTNGNNYAIVVNFAGNSGENPSGELLYAGNILYGATESAGSLGQGNVFRINPDGSGFTELHPFSSAEDLSGLGMRLSLVGNFLYGIGVGLNSDFSRLFRINTNGLGFAALGALPADIDFGYRTLTPIGTNLLFSGRAYVAQFGGIYQCDTNGLNFMKVREFSALEGLAPRGNMISVATLLYGATFDGGDVGEGNVFSFDVRPQLAAIRSGTGILLSWPAYASGYRLEQNVGLNGGTWIPSGSSPSNNGTNVTVQVPLSAPTTFFRLRM